MSPARCPAAALAFILALSACGGPPSGEALAGQAEANLAERLRLVELYGGDDGRLDAATPAGTLAGRPAECGYQDNDLTGRLERAIRVGKTITAETDDALGPGAFEALWRLAGCHDASRSAPG